MQKWPIVAATFHKEKFNKLILVLFKADGEIDQFFLAVVKQKFCEFLYFTTNVRQPYSESMRRPFMHTQMYRLNPAKAQTGPDLESGIGTAPVSRYDTNIFLGMSQILRPES